MTNPYRDMCAELLSNLEHSLFQNCLQGEIDNDSLIIRARTLLDQPEPEGPSDEDLTQFLFENFRGPIEFLCDAEEEAHLMIRGHVKFARAVLARWGNL